MTESGVRPARVCSQLLAALEASEGRRRRRKRNTTPDAIGMSIKRRLLELTVQDDPEPGDFEGWLWERCHSWDERDGSADSSVPASGGVRAMALTILAEWQLAQISPAFRGWLDAGAPSADAGST
jgi:hypothetical protein